MDNINTTGLTYNG